MTMLHHNVDDWLPIIRAEYMEFPGMQLTRAQVQRLWNLDEATCSAVIEALEAERFLRRTEKDNYVRVSG
jgi:Fic family protein